MAIYVEILIRDGGALGTYADAGGPPAMGPDSLGLTTSQGKRDRTSALPLNKTWGPLFGYRGSFEVEWRTSMAGRRPATSCRTAGSVVNESRKDGKGGKR